jgi:signal transduction histidine kinase
MLSERFRNLVSTLRIRLLLWMVVVVFVLVTVTMFGVRQLYRTRLFTKFDQGLEADVRLLQAETRQTFPDWRLWESNVEKIALAHPLHAWFAEVYDERGARLASGGLPPTLPAFSAADERAPHDALPYRFTTAPIDDLSEARLYLRVGGLRQPLDDDLVLLDQSMLVRSAIILLLAPVGGYVLALRATRPIAWIIATAARLQPSKLDERLPIRGTGDELDQLSRTINGLLDRIASYIDRNREFVAHAAHELRSPLAAIHSSVEVALNRVRSPEEYSALLGEVMEECHYLSNLVNRLLILAEGDAGRLASRDQTTRLDKIVRESLDMFEPVAEARGIGLRAAPLAALHVNGDESHLRQVVRNLLDNAIKFSPPGGTVTVELRADADSRQARIIVQDEGMGIPSQDLPHIFERFYRGDKSRQREPGRGGSGLGLSICQTIVQALKGDIAVTSRVGAGSTFTVSLPLAVSKDELCSRQENDCNLPVAQ